MRRGEGDVLKNAGEEGFGEVEGWRWFKVHVEWEVVLVAEPVLQRDEVDVSGDDVAEPARHPREGDGHKGTPRLS